MPHMTAHPVDPWGPYDYRTGYRVARVAAANFEPWKWQKDWNAARIEEFFVAAVRAGAELVVTPEGCLEGYVAGPAVLYPELRREMMRIAEPIDGPYVKRFQKLARQFKACLVFGMAERRGRRNVYNTAVFIDHRGEIRGTYQKTQLAEGYHPSWHFNRLGKQLRAFDTPLGRCGMMICNDRWNPLIARALCLDGARLICIPSFGSVSRQQDRAVLARGRENGVPVVLANVRRNLIVSKGEIVALDRGVDRITIAEIAIPDPITPAFARAVEREYLRQRPARMAAHLDADRKQYARRRRDDPHHGRPPKPRSRPPVIRDHGGGPGDKAE